jgi:hypothetical protein
LIANAPSDLAYLLGRVAELEAVLSALDGHDRKMLWTVARRLKGEDGEGWAVGEMVKRYIKLAQAGQEVE